MATCQYSCLGNPMDIGAWWATVHESQRIGHDWACESLRVYTQSWFTSLYSRTSHHTVTQLHSPKRNSIKSCISQGFRFWKSPPEPQKPSWHSTGALLDRIIHGTFACFLLSRPPVLLSVRRPEHKVSPHVEDWRYCPPAHLTLNPQGQTGLPFSVSNLPAPRVPLPSWLSLACRACLAFHSGRDYHPPAEAKSVIFIWGPGMDLWASWSPWKHIQHRVSESIHTLLLEQTHKFH